MILDEPVATLQEAVSACPDWRLNDPGLGAHRYYDDDWACLVILAGGTRWSTTILHSVESPRGLVHDVRTVQVFDDPRDAMRWSEGEVALRRTGERGVGNGG